MTFYKFLPAIPTVKTLFSSRVVRMKSLMLRMTEVL